MEGGNSATQVDQRGRTTTAGATVSRAGWVERSRLLRHTADAPVVLLSAPGGWGKSTLASQIARDRDAALVAVRLDADADVHAIVAAFRRALRRSGMTDLAELAPDAAPDSVADAWLGALAQRQQPIVVFVDETHRLSTDASTWVRGIADDLAAPHRMVVAGRSLDRVLLRRPGAGWVRLGPDELRFTVDEIAQLLDIDDQAQIEQIMTTTDGWPAALALTAAGSRLDPSADTPAQLLEVLLDDLLGTERRRLAPLGLLPLLDPITAQLAAGPGSFETLLASGVPMRRAGRWWTLADPLREALAADSPTLDSRAVTAIAAEYELHRGVMFLLDVGHGGAVLDLLAATHWSQLHQFAAPELDAILSTAVGGEAHDAPPPSLARALLNAARGAELIDPTLRRTWIDRGLELADPASDVWFELRAEAIRELTRQADPAALVQATELLAELPAGHPARPRLLLTVGIVNAYRGSPDELVAAERAFTEAAALLALSSESRWQAEALNRLAFMVSYHGGRVALAAEQQAAALALLTPGTRDWAVSMTYYADILDTLGRPAEAAAAATEAFEYGQRVGDPVATGYGAWSLAIGAAHRNDLDDTLRWLDEVERSPGNWVGEVTGQEFLAFGADLLGGLGERDRAFAYRERCAARVGAGGTQSLLDVVDGRLEAMFGDPQRAIELFERLDDEPYATVRTKWVRFMFRGLAALRSGDHPDAARWVERGLELVESMGLPDLPHRHETTLVGMLAPVWPRGAGTDSVVARIVTLGGFSVTRGSDVVTPAPGNPATLVKLLALRRTLTAEQAIDLLWPEADVTTGRARLRNLLNRIRSQSGELIVRDSEALALDPSVETDIARFEGLVESTLAAPVNERAGLARVAMAAYGGELLPVDAYEDWAVATRDRLRRRFLSLVDMVTDDSFERGDIDEAMRLLDIAVEQEPLDEPRYVRAAESLVNAGRPEAARDMVTRGERALDEIGVRPGVALATVSRALNSAAS